MRKTEAYLAEDGSIHGSVPEAVAHELDALLEQSFHGVFPTEEIRKEVAQRMTENPMRNHIMKILGQMT